MVRSLTHSELPLSHGWRSCMVQVASKTLMSQFDLIHITGVDQDWAMQQMEKFRLSHGIATNDCLIASVAYGLHLPLYTHNLKDMTPMIGSLAVKPYA